GAASAAMKAPSTATGDRRRPPRRPRARRAARYVRRVSSSRGFVESDLLRRRALKRARVRIGIRQEKGVRIELRAVSKCVSRQVAQPPRCGAADERDEPGEDRRYQQRRAECGVHDRGGDGEDHTERRLPAVLTRALRQLEVQRIGAGLTGEAREWI